MIRYNTSVRLLAAVSSRRVHRRCEVINNYTVLSSPIARAFESCPPVSFVLNVTIQIDRNYHQNHQQTNLFSKLSKIISVDPIRTSSNETSARFSRSSSAAGSKSSVSEQDCREHNSLSFFIERLQSDIRVSRCINPKKIVQLCSVVGEECIHTYLEHSASQSSGVIVPDSPPEHAVLSD